MDDAERKILDMIEEGQISAEDGLRLMNAMDNKTKSGELQVEIKECSSGLEDMGLSDQESHAGLRMPEEEKQRMLRMKRWWLLPFAVGLLITTLGAAWMFMGYSEHGFGFGFWLAWLPFILGIFIVAVSFRTSRSVWLHVRVKQKSGEKPQRITISIPLPMVLTKWVMSRYGDKIPGIKDGSFGDVSEILENISPENPFYVHVNEDDGEEVEVYIG
jgi:hypothetical protein